MMSEWLKKDSTPQYYFMKEYLTMKYMITLQPYHSHIQGITVCNDDPFVLKKTLIQSLERTKTRL